MYPLQALLCTERCYLSLKIESNKMSLSSNREFSWQIRLEDGDICFKIELKWFVSDFDIYRPLINKI